MASRYGTSRMLGRLPKSLRIRFFSVKVYGIFRSPSQWKLWARVGARCDPHRDRGDGEPARAAAQSGAPRTTCTLGKKTLRPDPVRGPCRCGRLDDENGRLLDLDCG